MTAAPTSVTSRSFGQAIEATPASVYEHELLRGGLARRVQIERKLRVQLGDRVVQHSPDLRARADLHEPDVTVELTRSLQQRQEPYAVHVDDRGWLRHGHRV